MPVGHEVHRWAATAVLLWKGPLISERGGSPSESCTLRCLPGNFSSLLVTWLILFASVAGERSFPGLNHETYALGLVKIVLYSVRDGSFCLMGFVEISCTDVFLGFKGDYVLEIISTKASSLLQSQNPIKDSYYRKENVTTETFIFVFWTGEVFRTVQAQDFKELNHKYAAIRTDLWNKVSKSESRWWENELIVL